MKIEVFIFEEYIEILRDELNKIGVCKMGEYDYCFFYSLVKGYWRFLEEVFFFNGEIG